jgi:hypothetical protein
MDYGDATSLNTALAESSFGMDFKICRKRDIYSRLDAGNSCLRSVEVLLSYSLLSINTKIKICRNIILPFVLYGCETWSVILKEERRLKGFENRVLRKIYGPKCEEIKENWRQLKNDELHDKCSSHNRLLRGQYD